jgi:hypothetical protein
VVYRYNWRLAALRCASSGARRNLKCVFVRLRSGLQPARGENNISLSLRERANFTTALIGERELLFQMLMILLFAMVWLQFFF